MKSCKIFIFSICLIVMQWSIAGAQLPCGLYKADKGLYGSFNFGDNMQVTVDAYRLEQTTYFIENNEISMKIGLRLKMVDENTLIGVGPFTRGNTYRRAEKSTKPCKSDPAIVEAQKCHGEAADLRRNRKFPEAIEKYKQCCDAGDPFSCNEYAVMKQLIEGDTKTAQIYYKKACDQGVGSACANLASNAFKAGEKAEGMRRLREACYKGHKSSCSEVILMEEQKD